MNHVARRHQPPITIRSTRAIALLRRLTAGGRSQADVIEEALERMVSERTSLAKALAPAERMDFEWEPEPSQIASRPLHLGD